MNVTNNGDNMDKESLVERIILCVYTWSTRNTLLTATCNNELAFFHIGKVYPCIVAPKLVKFKGALVT